MRAYLSALVLACGIAMPTPCPAQRSPEGWRWQLDRPAELVLGRDAPAGAWQFQEMIPGLHLTSGPGVLVFAPGDGAAGRFMVDADLLLFPNSGERGYGIVFGAGGAANPVASQWTAFMISATGEFCVVRHTPEGAKQLVEWRAHPAIVRKGKEVVTNRLRVAVERDSVRFLANAVQVGALPRSAVEPDGLFGLRAEEQVNLHVTNVDLVRRLLKR